MTELDIACAAALDAARQGERGTDKKGGLTIGGERSLAPLVRRYSEFPQAWSPSTNWEDAGRLIERFKPVMSYKDGLWTVRIEFHLYGDFRATMNASAPTLLVALCLCITKISELR